MPATTKGRSDAISSTDKGATGSPPWAGGVHHDGAPTRAADSQFAMTAFHTTRTAKLAARHPCRDIQQVSTTSQGPEGPGAQAAATSQPGRPRPGPRHTAPWQAPTAH
jgi:hypothetical protein